MAQYLNDILKDAVGSREIDWPGGPGSFICQGTFSNATFQLQYTLDKGKSPNWNDVPGAEMTIVDNDIGSFQLCSCRLRVEWTGGTTGGATPTDVNVRVAPAWQGWFNDPRVPKTLL